MKPTKNIFLIGMILILALAVTVGSLVSRRILDKTLASVFLEELTWTEVRQAIEDGANAVIIPTGGVEQNGPHMVLGKHNYIVRYTSEKIARFLGNTLVAPVVTYVPEGDINPPSGHMRFSGTISISEKDFQNILESTVLSLKQHGFEKFYFIGDSGSSQRSQQQVANKLSADGIQVFNIGDYYSRDQNSQVRWLLSRGETEASIGFHAGIRDTSELMAVYAKGIREDQLVSANKKFFGLSSGVNGDPTKASAEYGRKLLNLKIQAALKQIQKVTS